MLDRIADRPSPEAPSAPLSHAPNAAPAGPGATARKAAARRAAPPCRILGFVLAAGGITAIAAGAVFAAMSDVGPMATAFWRMALAAPLCFAICLAFSGADLGTMMRLIRRRETWFAAFGFAATLLLWYSGQRLSSVASTSALHNLTPAVVLLAGWVMSGIRPAGWLSAGLVLATLGSLVLVLHSGSVAERGALGDGLALMAAGGLAVYYVSVTRLREHADGWTIMAVVSLIAAPILILPALLLEGQTMPAATTGWLKLAALALLGQVIGQACLAQAARSLGAVGISVSTLGEPAMAAILAMVLMSAPFAPEQAVGIAVVTLGIWICQRWTNRTA